MLGDIKDPRLLILKGFLFLLTALLAGAGLLLERPDLRTVCARNTRASRPTRTCLGSAEL